MIIRDNDQYKDKVLKCHEITQLVNGKNSPIKGWGGFSKNVQKMSKTSIIELSQLGQDWFNF